MNLACACTYTHVCVRKTVYSSLYGTFTSPFELESFCFWKGIICLIQYFISETELSYISLYWRYFVSIFQYSPTQQFDFQLNFTLVPFNLIFIDFRVHVLTLKKTFNPFRLRCKGFQLLYAFLSKYPETRFYV